MDAVDGVERREIAGEIWTERTEIDPNSHFNGGLRRECDPAVAFDADHELEIIEDREVGEPADAVAKAAIDEQGVER